MSRPARATLALLALLAAGPAGAQSRDLTIDGPAGRLSGTLTAGDTVRDAALILPGSGPTDRDGNSPLGLHTDSYRLLAEALRPMGIATLRIDKRGIGDSGGDPNAVSLAAYRADTAAWAAALRDETGAACVWLIGHSEGGLIALASADLPDICGLILIATPGRPLRDIVLDQVAAQPTLAPFAQATATALDQLAAGTPPDTGPLPPPLAALFAPEVAGYLAELLRTDPAGLIASVTRPVLVIGGDADTQVPPDEATLLAQAQPRATLRLLAGLTHTLKQADPADPVAGARTYTDPSRPIHPALPDAIAAFLRRGP